MKLNLNKLFFPHDNKPEHFKALDGLRGIAVLFVLLSHTSNANIFIHEYLNFSRIGKVGVYLFFVLSAYLLDRQIALTFMSGKSSKIYWLNYTLRRFLRIYPLFVVALILHGLLTLAGINTVIDKIWDIPLHMLLIKGESIFWSIPVEFKYYFISPLLMWFLHKFLKWNKNKLALTFIILILSTILIQTIYGLPLVSTLRYFPIFLVGTLISIYEIIIINKTNIKIKPVYFTLIGFSSAIIILMTIPYYFKKIFNININFHSSIFYFPYAILWGVILLSAKYGKGLLKKILELKILRFFGSISFSMYLFHMLFLNLIKTTELHPQIQIYVFFILTTIFSTLSFLLIELPLSKIRIRSDKIREKNIKK